MSEIHHILKKYWGYDAFRPLQEDIIQSALAGKDSLALLPTGGGKSICFQVPVMAREGLGLVVSPLIALMSDQVAQLKQRGIRAVALNSTLSAREKELALQNAANGYYKFIYLSPEKLRNEEFRQRLKYLKINFLIVDEAHCISQWGYDFRPPYLEIAAARELLPEVPVLALTATATPVVVQDIQDRLHFGPNGAVFRKSFQRPELSYNVLHTENKWERARRILNRIPGTAIIYLRNRRGTVEVSQWLQSLGYSADFYHAGLSSAERAEKQADWIENRTRIMVCTNAFGMGIDKPDVRLVLHLDLPDSLEAYFQEAGRGARDGKQAYAVLLVGPSDCQSLLRKHLGHFPDRAFMQRCYHAIANYLRLANGAGEGQSFPFSFSDFIKQYRLPPMMTHNAFSILAREGLLEFSESLRQAAKVLIKADRRTLYEYQVRNEHIHQLVLSLTRSYGGLDTDFGQIDEDLIAQRLNISTYRVKEGLQHMHQQGLIEYQAASDGEQLRFLQARKSPKELVISQENLERRRQQLEARLKAMVDFVNNSQVCRSVQVLAYFGESPSPQCGQCEVCRRKARIALSHKELEAFSQSLRARIPPEGLSVQELQEQYGDGEKAAAIRFLLDEEYLRLENERIFWHKEEK